jgi:3-hydroxybutyryl-CoA dehydratase
MSEFEYDEIKIGETFEFKRIITLEDMNTFADLTGDYNPLHCDEEYAKKSEFGARIAHGMLAGSLFSTLVGMVCPGKRNLYLSQSLLFKRPIIPKIELTIRGKVKERIESVKMIIMNTQIIQNGKIAIEGEARVKVRGD